MKVRTTEPTNGLQLLEGRASVSKIRSLLWRICEELYWKYIILFLNQEHDPMPHVSIKRLEKSYRERLEIPNLWCGMCWILTVGFLRSHTKLKMHPFLLS